MKLFFAIVFYIFCVLPVLAQPALPVIDCQLQPGAVSLEWTCQYDAVKAIIVKRSADSMHDYQSIGELLYAPKGPQSFVDTLPLAGKSFYKVAVIFNSDLVWHSNHCRVSDGSDSLRRVSIYVFANKTTGHIDVRLPDSDEKRHLYSLAFYNLKGTEVMHIPRLKVKSIVIDKRNFQRKGFYRFELQKDGKVFETGYVFIKI